MRNTGLSLRKISKSIPASLTMVHRTIEVNLDRENGTSQTRTRRPRKTTLEQDKALVDYFKINPDAIYSFARAKLCPHLSLSTLKRRLHTENMRKWQKLQRLPLKAEHAVKRLQWAKEHVNWKKWQWNRVVWSDECSVEHGKEIRREWVFCVLADKWKLFAIQPRPCSGRVSVMVWAAFSGVRHSELVVLDGDPLSKRGGVSGWIYLEMLQKQLLTLLDDDLIFMQDNTPIYTYKQVANWFQEMGITVME